MGEAVDNEFVAIKTSDRSAARGDFIVAMTREQKRRCRIHGFWIFGNHCVIQHWPTRRDSAKFENATSLGNRPLKVPARVVVTDEDLTKAAPERARSETVRVDLSLRAALGIDTTVRHMGTQSLVSIYPLKLGLWTAIKEFASRIFGRRYQFLRVTRGFLPDLEANIARARPEVLATLGCDETGAAIAQTIVEEPLGDQPRLFRWLRERVFHQTIRDRVFHLRSVRVKILPFDKIEFDSRMVEEAKPDTEIFVSPNVYFGVEKDLPRFALNEELRQRLGVSTFEPVLLRRDMWRALLAESINFGILALLTALAIPKLAGGTYAVVATVAGAGVLVVLRIRSAVK